MALSAGDQHGSAGFRGLEQFHTRGDADGVGYCIAAAKPYALEFSNNADVICLLLGDINTTTKFEDNHEGPLVFLGESTAFHPRVGNVRVRADEVRHGFIAFNYSPDFQGFLDDRSIAGLRRDGSCNNIRSDAIKFLARYVRERLRRPEALQALELQFFALGTYVEAPARHHRRHASRHALRPGIQQALRLHRAKPRGKTYLRRPLPGGEPAAADRIRRRETSHRTLTLQSGHRETD